MSSLAAHVTGRKQRKLNGAAAKAYSIWKRLVDAGVIRSEKSSAFRAYVTRVTGRSDVRFCDGADARTLIESLKAWAGREGVEI